jgi:hypothetical protein
MLISVSEWVLYAETDGIKCVAADDNNSYLVLHGFPIIY